MPDIKSKSFVHEDWAVVIAGFLIILIAIAGQQKTGCKQHQQNFLHAAKIEGFWLHDPFLTVC